MDFIPMLTSLPHLIYCWILFHLSLPGCGSIHACRTLSCSPWRKSWTYQSTRNSKAVQRQRKCRSREKSVLSLLPPAEFPNIRATTDEHQTQKNAQKSWHGLKETLELIQFQPLPWVIIQPSHIPGHPFVLPSLLPYIVPASTDMHFQISGAGNFLPHTPWELCNYGRSNSNWRATPPSARNHRPAGARNENKQELRAPLLPRVHKEKLNWLAKTPFSQQIEKWSYWHIITAAHLEWWINSENSVFQGQGSE